MPGNCWSIAEIDTLVENTAAQRGFTKPLQGCGAWVVLKLKNDTTSLNDSRRFLPNVHATGLKYFGLA